jgi:hypothetical protein
MISNPKPAVRHDLEPVPATYHNLPTSHTITSISSSSCDLPCVCAHMCIMQWRKNVSMHGIHQSWECYTMVISWSNRQKCACHPETSGETTSHAPRGRCVHVIQKPAERQLLGASVTR